MKLLAYYLRLVEILICKTPIDFGNKKSKITGVDQVNYGVDDDKAILRKILFYNKVSILN